MIDLIYKNAHVLTARSGAGFQSLEIYKETGLMFLRKSSIFGPVESNAYFPVGGVDTGYILILPYISKLFDIDYFTLLN